MIPWTNDSFAGGGTLVDEKRPWAGRDKVQHVISWLLLARLEIHWLHWNTGTVFLTGLGLAIGWEFLVEWPRYRRWVAKGLPQPQPENTDLPSWRDIVAGLVGTALGIWVF